MKCFVLKYTLKFNMVVVFVFLSTSVLFGQDNETPGAVGLTNPAGPVGAVPVDGGLSLLLAAGLGFGAKKTFDYRKSIKEQVES